MKTIALTANKRNEVGSSSAKQIRKEGNIPCNFYGSNGNINFFVNEIAFNKIINSPEVFFVELAIEGKKLKAIIKEVQFNPVTDKTIHVDFLEVTEDKLLNITLPIKTTGVSKGILAGGKLRIVTRRLKVRALAKDLPEFISIDISSLKLGQAVKVGELAVPGITFLDAANAVVVAVKTSRAAVSAASQDDDEAEVTAEAEATTA